MSGSQSRRGSTRRGHTTQKKLKAADEISEASSAVAGNRRKSERIFRGASGRIHRNLPPRPARAGHAPVNTTVVSAYRDLADLDIARDLDGHVVRVTSAGLSYERRAPCDFTANQLLEFYYHLALTRAVDREIVKLSRKGLALGKHLM